MMSSIKKLLYNEDGYVYVIVAIMIILSVIYAGIRMYEPIVQRDHVFHMTSVLVNEIEETGEINTEIMNLQTDLCNEFGITPTITYQGSFINSVRRGNRVVQLGETFYVDVELTIPVEIIDPMFTSAVTYDIVIKRRLKGVGQVYWRPSEI